MNRLPSKGRGEASSGAAAPRASSSLVARLASSGLLLALMLISSCRCGADPDDGVTITEPEPTATVETHARQQTRREALVADAAVLDDTDLSTIEFLDLALSERDAQERPLPLPEPPPEPPPEPQSDESGETAAGPEDPPLPPGPSPRCEGLDLHEVASRAPQLIGLRISGCQAAVHAGLSAFGSRLRELELVDLELDAVTVARLSQLHGLERLTLTRVHAEPGALKPLGRKISPQSLTLRELEDNSPVSEIVRILDDIREIRVIGPWVSHDTMIRIGKARRLERLAVIDTEITNFSLHQIKTLDHLRELEWSGPGFANTSPIYIRDLPLDTLICNCPRFGDKGLHHLYLLPGLRKLVLERSAASSAGLAELAVLSQLSDLTLRYVDLDAEGFAALAQLPLERLIIGPGKLEDPEAAGLGGITGLRELVVELEGFGDAAAAQLATLVALEHLDLGGTAISDEGLEHLAGLTQMKTLELHHTRVTKHGLAHLAGMRGLEVLELDHTDVVDEGVAHLASLSSLRELRLDHTLITDAALVHLLELEQLERLNLADTVVSAEGVAGLEQLPQLTAVYLAGTRVIESP